MSKLKIIQSVKILTQTWCYSLLYMYRYFTCQPMYGLFAPVAKVSLSPSPHRRPSCSVHPPPSGPVRQNTKDSISSTASSRMSGIRVRLGVNSLQVGLPPAPSVALSHSLGFSVLKLNYSFTIDHKFVWILILH